MLCNYCQTEQNEQKKCFFCGADLTQTRPKKKQSLTHEEAYQNQPLLATYHTYDLLLLLSHLRDERSHAYKTMQSVRKAPQEAKIGLAVKSFKFKDRKVNDIINFKSIIQTFSRVPQ